MTLLMAATHNAAGLMALRFFMGMMEAPALPCLTLITVMWYRKSEKPLRVALWSSTFASVSFVSTAILLPLTSVLGLCRADLVWNWTQHNRNRFLGTSFHRARWL